MNWFNVPNLANLWGFRKIRCKLSEIWEPKFANIYKEIGWKLLKNMATILGQRGDGNGLINKIRKQ